MVKAHSSQGLNSCGAEVPGVSEDVQWGQAAGAGWLWEAVEDDVTERIEDMV